MYKQYGDKFEGTPVAIKKTNKNIIRLKLEESGERVQIDMSKIRK